MREVTFAPGAVREAYASAASGLVSVAARIPPDAWQEPGLGAWTVRDLVGHAGRAFTTVSSYLETGAGKAIELQHPFDYFSVYGATFGDPAAVEARGRQAGADLGPDPAAQLAVLRDEALAATRDAPDAAPVQTAAGVMRLIDYLPSRIFELVVHSADISSATGLEISVDTGPAVIAVVLAAAVAAERDDFLDPLLGLTGRRALPLGYSIL